MIESCSISRAKEAQKGRNRMLKTTTTTTTTATTATMTGVALVLVVVVVGPTASAALISQRQPTTTTVAMGKMAKVAGRRAGGQAGRRSRCGSALDPFIVFIFRLFSRKTLLDLYWVRHGRADPRLETVAVCADGGRERESESERVRVRVRE